MLKLKSLVLSVVFAGVALGALGCVEQSPGDEMDLPTVAEAQEEAKRRCDYEDPNMLWQSQDAALCASILWNCDAGWTMFTNECGCGCFLDCSNPTYQYVGTSRKACSKILWNCPEGSAPFSDNTGCGCVSPAGCS